MDPYFCQGYYIEFETNFTAVIGRITLKLQRDLYWKRLPARKPN